MVALTRRAEGALLDELVAAADVVLDCSDNFATRQAVNRACVRLRKPLVSGAAVRFNGQISVFDLRRDTPGNAEAPCYACLFPEGEEVDPTPCATLGVFAPLTGIIGCMQAAEALKCLVRDPASKLATLAGRLLLLDARSMEWQAIRLARDPGCPVCKSAPADL